MYHLDRGDTPINDASVAIDLGNFLMEDGITVSLGGVIDSLSMPLIEVPVFSDIERGCKSIVFDFKTLISIDAEPIGFIKACSNILAEKGGLVKIVNANSQITHLFRLLELGDLIY